MSCDAQILHSILKYVKFNKKANTLSEKCTKLLYRLYKVACFSLEAKCFIFFRKSRGSNDSLWEAELEERSFNNFTIYAWFTLEHDL